MKYSFGRPTEKDIEYVAKNLRRDNRQELTALCGAGHELDVLQASVKYSELVGCFYIDGVPAAIYGVRSPAVICSVKRVWLLMTDETLKHRLSSRTIHKTLSEGSCGGVRGMFQLRRRRQQRNFEMACMARSENF